MTERLLFQTALWSDKRNPQFSFLRTEEKSGWVYVFLGAEMLDVVPDDRRHPAYRLLVARLYNSGFNLTALACRFAFARTTIRRWGRALANGDAEQLLKVLYGHRGRRKFTAEIEAFVRLRFGEVYRRTRYDYSARIRAEIEQVFGRSLSAETLRPLFGELKRAFTQGEAAGEAMLVEEAAGGRDGAEDEDAEGPQGTAEPQSDGSLGCDWAESAEEPTRREIGFKANHVNALDATPAPGAIEDKSHNRNSTLQCAWQRGGPWLVQHAGVLLFASMLNSLEKTLNGTGQIVKQWTAAILLGAANVEQSKLLNHGALQTILGKQLCTLGRQRARLVSLSETALGQQLFAFNADLLGAGNERVFYYDPHTKQYSGAEKILKGWCPKIRGVAKVLHMDFVHTQSGAPLYVEHCDNFHDLRERFPRTAENLRGILALDGRPALTFIADRGLFKKELFVQVRNEGHHLVTWEKGYKSGQWDESQCLGEFILPRQRNNASDLRIYRFRYMARPWEKDPTLRQIIVMATNPEDRSVEVSILATDSHPGEEQIIRWIFQRWLQENDFKYLGQHFGINEITSYAMQDYKDLEQVIEDRQMQSGQYKSLLRQKDELLRRLGKELTLSHLTKKTTPAREETIGRLTKEIDNLKSQIDQTKKRVSRLQTLIENQCRCFDTRPKALMDAVRIVAHNIFLQAFHPFRVLYDNYRDDHVVLRNLSHADGCVLFNDRTVEILLLPTMQYPRKVQRIVEQYLQQINQIAPIIPDGSQRTLRFSIPQERSNLFAIGSGAK